MYVAVRFPHSFYLLPYEFPPLYRDGFYEEAQESIREALTEMGVWLP